MSQMNPDEKYEFYVYNYSSNGAKIVMLLENQKQ